MPLQIGRKGLVGSQQVPRGVCPLFFSSARKREDDVCPFYTFLTLTFSNYPLRTMSVSKAAEGSSGAGEGEGARGQGPFCEKRECFATMGRVSTVYDNRKERGREKEGARRRLGDGRRICLKSDKNLKN
ncbi:hypothetical protein GWI33_015559 [Rhynchophorus ferrugineus]|uniref:Uncharacterized protein n=1 Tax=Rhynchophorus ferrugineus TaxID=354439 RepID=A0A834M5W5_RHYFE|nr:hypothetical protein GWI33_015559 [Rhynchophorus ferrugineus]